MTLEISFKSKEVQLPNSSKSIKLAIWDTAGEEKFWSITKMYYRDAKAVCVVFDITNSDSFMKAREWIEEIR